MPKPTCRKQNFYRLHVSVTQRELIIVRVKASNMLFETFTIELVRNASQNSSLVINPSSELISIQFITLSVLCRNL